MSDQRPTGADVWWTDDEWWRRIPKALRVPRRFTGAFWIAVGVTGLIGGAAAGTPPWGPYSPIVAIQALTATAIVWYTFFTYRAAQSAEPTRIHVDPAFHLGQSPSAGIEVHNRSERDVEARVWGDIYGDDDQIKQIDSRRRLSPYDDHSILVRLEEIVAERDGYGDVSEFSVDRLEVEAWVNWRDDIGERGTIGPRNFSSAL